MIVTIRMSTPGEERLVCDAVRRWAGMVRIPLKDQVLAPGESPAADSCLLLWDLDAGGTPPSAVLEGERSGRLLVLRRLRHDMRHYAITAGAMSETAASQTGDSAIGSLVEHYRRQAEDLGIAADLMLDLDGCGDEMLPDLCLVVSNLLENAVEALHGQKDGWLRARSCYTEGYITLVIGNSCAVPLRQHHGTYRSSKVRGRSGIGLATVYDVARHYGGRAVFTADGKQFMASVFLTRPHGSR